MGAQRSVGGHVMQTSQHMCVYYISHVSTHCFVFRKKSAVAVKHRDSVDEGGVFKSKKHCSKASDVEPTISRRFG